MDFEAMLGLMKTGAPEETPAPAKKNLGLPVGDGGSGLRWGDGAGGDGFGGGDVGEGEGECGAWCKAAAVGEEAAAAAAAASKVGRCRSTLSNSCRKRLELSA